MRIVAGLLMTVMLLSSVLAAEGKPDPALADYVPVTNERHVPQTAYDAVAQLLKRQATAWNALKGFSADLRIDAQRPDAAAPEVLQGRLTLRVVKKIPHDGREPWAYPYEFADPAGAWSIRRTGSADPVFQAPDEATRQRLQACTVDGQFLDLCVMPLYFFSAYDSHFQSITQNPVYALLLPPAAQAQTPFNPESDEFAIRELPEGNDKVSVFRGGQLLRWICRKDSDFQANKVITFEQYTALPGGPMLPGSVTFTAGGAAWRLTLSNLSPVQ